MVLLSVIQVVPSRITIRQSQRSVVSAVHPTVHRVDEPYCCSEVSDNDTD